MKEDRTVYRYGISVLSQPDISNPWRRCVFWWRILDGIDDLPTSLTFWPAIDIIDNYPNDTDGRGNVKLQWPSAQWYGGPFGQPMILIVQYRYSVIGIGCIDISTDDLLYCVHYYSDDDPVSTISYWLLAVCDSIVVNDILLLCVD